MRRNSPAFVVKDRRPGSVLPRFCAILCSAMPTGGGFGRNRRRAEEAAAAAETAVGQAEAASAEATGNRNRKTDGRMKEGKHEGIKRENPGI